LGGGVNGYREEDCTLNFLEGDVWREYEKVVYVTSSLGLSGGTLLGREGGKKRHGKLNTWYAGFQDPPEPQDEGKKRS